ncbi:MAG TPA: GNAT family N-acetyltransferase [Chitinispirillaceae bacterium]|nr:GNAT family N-acetyltransferase [Chitinispirillaceae bacterium]
MPIIKNIQVLGNDESGRNEWDEIAHSSRYATFFHSSIWASLCCDLYEKATQVCFRLTFDDSVTLYLPSILETKLFGMINRYFSMPCGTYGGFIYSSDTRVTPEHIKVGLDYLFKKDNWVMRENPFDPIGQFISSGVRADDFTQCVAVDSGYTAFESGTDYAHKKNIKKAMQAGLQVEVTEDWTRWVDYYTVYKKSISRWEEKKLLRRSFYPLEFIKKIFELDAKYRKLWIATRNGKIASGIICFYWNRHAVAWHGAGDHEFFNARPNNLLYDQAIQHACTNNYLWFDCNPSGGFEGVIKFKKFLGTLMMPSGVISKSNGVLNLIHSVRKLALNPDCSSIK